MNMYYTNHKKRIKKTPVSNNKTSTSKQKVKKKNHFFIIQEKYEVQKGSENSKYSKSTKLSPSSGDGQKKWTTLEQPIRIPA